MRARVLVTGASGFAGWHLTTALAPHHDVVGTYLERPIRFEHAAAECVDLSDEHAARALVRSVRPTAVVHTAALTEPNDCERRPDAATRANVTATRNLLQALDEAAPDAHLVAFSTDLVYPGDRALSRESDPVGPVMHYGRTKLEAEEAVRSRRGPSTILRCALLYGPAAPYKGGATGWMRTALERGEPLTLFTDEHRTPVHVADVVALVTRLLASSSGHGTLNLGGSERLTRFAMGEVLAEAMCAPRELLHGVPLARSTMAAPRPADVSMRSEAAALLLGRPLLSFQEGVRRRIAASAKSAEDSS